MDSFIGQILLVAFNYAPQNFALCQGQLLPIGPNVPLFSVLGTLYGGDGINTFALPDLRGRVPVGFGQSALFPTYYMMGLPNGYEQSTLTPPNLPAGMGLSAGTATVSVPTGGTATDPKVALPIASGSSTPINNMQPYLVLNYIICVNGLYPSRN